MITISPPTEPQRLVVRAWLRKQMTGGGAHVRFGDVSVRGAAAREAARACEEAVFNRSELLVACLDAVPGEPVGFVAWSPASDDRSATLHYVYVIGPDPEQDKRRSIRRLGIGLRLLRAAVGDGSEAVRTAASTPAGEALLAAFRRQSTRAAYMAPEQQESNPYPAWGYGDVHEHAAERNGEGPR